MFWLRWRQVKSDDVDERKSRILRAKFKSTNSKRISAILPMIPCAGLYLVSVAVESFSSFATCFVKLWYKLLEIVSSCQEIMAAYKNNPDLLSLLENLTNYDFSPLLDESQHGFTLRNRGVHERRPLYDRYPRTELPKPKYVPPANWPKPKEISEEKILKWIQEGGRAAHYHLEADNTEPLLQPENSMQGYSPFSSAWRYTDTSKIYPTYSQPFFGSRYKYESLKETLDELFGYTKEELNTRKQASKGLYHARGAHYQAQLGGETQEQKWNWLNWDVEDVYYLPPEQQQNFNSTVGTNPLNFNNCSTSTPTDFSYFSYSSDARFFTNHFSSTNGCKKFNSTKYKYETIKLIRSLYIPQKEVQDNSMGINDLHTTDKEKGIGKGPFCHCSFCFKNKDSFEICSSHDLRDCHISCISSPKIKPLNFNYVELRGNRNR